MSKIIIDKATIADCVQCHKLSESPELATPKGNAPPLFWFKNIVKENQILLVAKLGKKVIGFRMGERIAGNWAIAHLMVVSPIYQNKGVGTMLVDAFEVECKKRNLQGIMTYIYNKENTLNFFKNRGYYLGSTVVEAIKPLNKRMEKEL